MNKIAMPAWHFPARRLLASACAPAVVARTITSYRHFDYMIKPRPTVRFLLARTFSSNRSSDSSHDAFKSSWGLPFSVSPERALEKFEKWARVDQGLNSFLMRPDSVRIAAAYCPVWCFDVNVRYIVKDPVTGRSRFHWKPDIFKVYGTQSVIHLPGLVAYAGYTYRRSLIDPLHNTSLIFLGDKLVRWSDWMLRDMRLQATGDRLTIFPDPWNTTRGRAFSLVKEALEALPEASDPKEGGERDVRVQTEILRSRRVYMPTFVVEYKVLGMEYLAFVSGCDDGAPVSGISHKVFDVSNEEASSFLSSAASMAQQGLQVVGIRRLPTLVAVLLQFLGNVLARLSIRLPIIGALGGAFVGFRKVIRPWMDNRSASAEWERLRNHEATMDDVFEHVDDFADSGTAEKYFQANRGRILHHLGGEQAHEEGSFDWYSQWEQWARKQWERQQQAGQYNEYQQRQQQQQQSSQRQQRRGQKQTKQEYQWDFDVNDPYSVLGLQRGASMEEVSAAFRKQMMMHHPDTKADASPAEKARAVERSKLISQAYQQIKSRLKK